MDNARDNARTDATRAIAQMLEARFGKVEAQALVFGRARVINKDVQFMDVKHISELCERYRARVRAQITAYRLWADNHRTESDAISRLYGAAEGEILRKRIEDDLKLWYFAHRDYHALRKAYLMKCLGPRAQVDWSRAA